MLASGRHRRGEEYGELMTSKISKAAVKFFTVEDIAGCMEVCPRTVRRWIKKGRLVVHRFNGVVRISDADFQTFLSTHRDSDASANVHQSPSKSAA
jgi:excisionase family DNA binding protein